MRTASVLVPRRTRKLSKAGWLPPSEFWMNARRARSSSIPADDGAAHDVGVAVQVLRRRVDDQIGAEIERPLEVRGHEGVVDAEAHAARRADGGDGADVGQAQQRVGRRLQPAELRARLDGGGHRLRIARIDIAEAQAEAAEHLLEQPVRPAVEIVARDDVVAGVEHRQHGGRRRDAGVEREPPGRRPRAPPGWPPARTASGSACASTRSRCAAPGAFCANVEVRNTGVITAPVTGSGLLAGVDGGGLEADAGRLRGAGAARARTTRGRRLRFIARYARPGTR